MVNIIEYQINTKSAGNDKRDLFLEEFDESYAANQKLNIIF